MGRTSSKINVLALESTFELGGAERITFNILRGLDREKFNVIICTLYDPGSIGALFNQEGFQCYRNIIGNRFDLRALKRLRNIIAENDIHLIYLINQPLTLFWGFLTGKLCRVPVIAAVHNTYDSREELKLRLYRFFLPRVDKIIAVAELQKKHLVEKENIPGHRIEVIYNGIEQSVFFPDLNGRAKRGEWGIADKAAVVGVVARLVQLKGVDVFCRAAKLVLEQAPGTHFIVVGDGPERNRLERMAREWGIANRLRFLGERSDIPELLSAIDIAVLSSRTEALPMAVLEYMAMGKPIVASRVGSVPELIVDGETGFLVEPEDPDALAERILTLIGNRDVRRRMGTGAQRAVQQRFRLASTIQKTEELFSSIAEARSRTALVHAMTMQD